MATYLAVLALVAANVFQRSQDRDTKELKAQHAEIIYSLERANNHLAHPEDLPDDELSKEESV